MAFALFIYILLSLYGLYSVLFSHRVSNFTLENSVYTMTVTVIIGSIFSASCFLGTQINSQNHRTAFLVNKALGKTKDPLTLKMASFQIHRSTTKYLLPKIFLCYI